jgi:hypothetical protein
MSDPIHEENGQWFFWDETWADRLGPYPTEARARQRLEQYCHFLDTGEVPLDLQEESGLCE